MVLAGITLYNPELDRLEENIASIQNQVDRIICVDNGSKNIVEIETFLKKNFPDIIFRKTKRIVELQLPLIRYSSMEKKRGLIGC